MKMTESIFCCEKCFGNIARCSVPAAKLWMHFCEAAVASSDILSIYNDFPLLKTLEEFGFIVTLEDPECVKVKLIGRKRDLVGIYFCRGDCGY